MHAPIGGISFITNLLIVIVGSLARFFHFRTERTLPVGHHPKKSHTGEVFLRTLLIAIPFIITTVLSALSIMTIVRLHHDERKVSIIDVVQVAYLRGVAGAEVLSEKFASDSTALYTPVPHMPTRPVPNIREIEYIADRKESEPARLTISREADQGAVTQDNTHN